MLKHSKYINNAQSRPSIREIKWHSAQQDKLCKQQKEQRNQQDFVQALYYHHKLAQSATIGSSVVSERVRKKNQVTSVISAEPNNEQPVIVSEDKFSILDGGAFNEENLFGLTKHYRQESQSFCRDTRFYIEFSRELLIHLLAVFSQNNRNLAERDTPPFFGFSETLLREVLIVALINKHQSANECLDVRQLQFSLSGKNIIRNLLHTAYKSNQDERAFFEYKTDTGIKACYIRVFREACEELVARNKKGREEDLNIASSLSYGDRESCLDSNKNSNSGTSALTKI